MSDKALKPARKPPATAWKPGQSGNPKGRAQGSRNRATLAAQALIDGQADALMAKALEMALAGDAPVLKAMLDRLCPPRKDSPVTLAGLPKIEGAADLPKVTSTILEAVARGDITPSEGQALTGLVEGHRKALEAADFEKRLSTLEGQMGGTR
ncbi:hypothetical protein NNJEOMEG_00169 [Fundidesulfovibrio magnetotacticus]|uniref:DUF5681 domain-containing protein n=1 Tax=Fundidesulfovibrio magnetotacticus TaxID=2730080 RepID=A0A6V8LVR9_9BACT|nr:DUF5681 domain-containing protein [Fundidesulfovibrio magnetotacticus]GFK92345.1 hypothetical protein NNJEOMEG_00169 [Fundidesulfovibrio magnetotacticus]